MLVTRLAWKVGKLRGVRLGIPRRCRAHVASTPHTLRALRDDKMLHCMKRKGLERMERVGPEIPSRVGLDHVEVW